MKPRFVTLKKNHYSSDKYNPNFLGAEELYRKIGHDIEDLKKQNPGYVNTCAVRMSLALLKSGVSFVGRLKVKEGPFNGEKVEPGAKLLADQLKQPHIFG